MSDQQQEPVITVTEAAREKAQWFRSRDQQPERLALWLEVTGASQGKYTYNMYLEELAKAAPGDVVQHHDDLPVVIPEASVGPLRGAVLDRDGDLETGGIFVRNPNTPTPPVSPAVGAAAPMGDLTGDVAQRVQQVLEQQINPQIASHGGRAELLGVEGDTAYLRLGGGCQGCGMASVTLSQGIEVAIKQAVPEILNVVDATDHASGTNPYFESSKK